MKRYILPLIFCIPALLTPLLVARANGQDTCPQSEGWTKIDSDDLSLYPVDGATEYCFKAGSSNSQGCEGGLFESWPQPEGTCGLSHWAYFIPEPEETATPIPTDEPTPTETPVDDPTPTPTDEFDPTPTPTEESLPSPTPTDTELPKAGFVSQGEIMNGEPWQLTVPGYVWAGHNQSDWPAGQWWMLWEGLEFQFNGAWYTTIEYIIADPTEVELIRRAADFDLMLITCRGYNPITNTWAQRLVIFANLSN